MKRNNDSRDAHPMNRGEQKMRSINARKTILFVHPGFELYGADKMLLLNVQVVMEKYPNNKIIVILPKTGLLAEALAAFSNVEVRIEKMGAIRKYDMKRMDFSALFWIIRFFRLVPLFNSCELVYINTLVVIDFMLAARFTRTKVFIHVHEIPGGIASHVFGWLLRFSRASLLFVSEASQRSFRRLTNKYQYMIWNGCASLKRIPETERTDQRIRLLLIGRINTMKGQELLVRALGLLDATKKKAVCLRIVGDVFESQQKLKANLMKCIEDEKVMDMVEVLPFSATPELFYNWADVILMPSLLPESFGLVAIEAMSLGKLVIAASHGGLTEIIKNNVCGMLFEPGNDKDLALKISEIIQNPHLIFELGHKGFEVYKDKFSEEIYMKKLIEIIETSYPT